LNEKGVALSALLATVAPSAVYAQAQLSEDIESINVTGMKLEESLPAELARQGTRVTVIPAARIKDGGHVDVAEALQTLAPGLYVSSKNGPFDYVDISFQGSRTSEVLWLIDGIRINNRLYAGTTPLDTLPASMVERIEVIEGGQALFYGTQGAAGAVNIVSKFFSDTPSGGFTVGGGSHNGKHVDGYFRTRIGGHKVVVFASNDKASGIQPFPDADFQPSSTDRKRGYDVLNFGGRYAYDFSDALTATAAYQHTTAQLDFARPALAARNTNKRDEDLLSLKLDYAPSETAQIFVKGYSHWWDTHYTQYNNVIGNPGRLVLVSDHDYWGFRDYGLNVMSKLALNRGFEYFLGYDFQNYTGRDEVLVIHQQTESVHAVFAQVRTTPDLISDGSLAAGIRYNAPSIGKSSMIWNVTGLYNLAPDALVVRGSVGTAFRLPTVEELLADDPGYERGNPDLKPERTTTANLSIGGDIGTVLHWDVTGFYRRTRDLIDFATFDAVTNQDVYGNVAGHVTARGVQFDLNAKVDEDLSANASFTYTRSRQSAAAVQFNRVPVTQFKAGIDYHPAALPFGASATLLRVGNVYDTLSGGIGRREYGKYTVMNLGARFYIDSDRHHRLSVNVDNVFDKEYRHGHSA